MTPMEIKSYKTLIVSLPVREQCFTTKRTTWNKAENEIVWLKVLNEKLFGVNDTLTINRQDIIETSEPREVIIKTIYWGYSSGMRGNHFINILKHISTIENELRILREKENPTTQDFKNITLIFKGVGGLGLSTYSKLLYFSKISFNRSPCLILDQRLIDVFANNIFTDFQELSNMRYFNAEKKYINFLSKMKSLADSLKVKEENLEQFLFLFGRRLKPYTN